MMYRLSIAVVMLVALQVRGDDRLHALVVHGLWGSDRAQRQLPAEGLPAIRAAKAVLRTRHALSEDDIADAVKALTDDDKRKATAAFHRLALAPPPLIWTSSSSMPSMPGMPLAGRS